LSLLAVAAGGAGSLRPVAAGTQVGPTPAAQLVLRFAEPCTVLPGGTPMGRPDGVRAHRLPAERYRPALEDDRGVYFASPTGIQVTEPAPRGTRTRAGGVYVSRDGNNAWEYLGDADGISTRQVLPGHCRFSVEPAAAGEP
ncbi:MAG TPA: hypothetical protein VMG12_20365, partial [Polyangiaceae bacterium]|nr:hypothetical protein [Polyangiaceae bacterium]